MALDTDFPISITVDPSQPVRATGQIGDAISRLDALATKTAQHMQETFTRNLDAVAAKANGAFGAAGQGRNALGQGGNRPSLPLPLTNTQQAQHEIEGLIQGFNNSAVAASRARGAFVATTNETGILGKATNFLKSEVGQLALAYASLEGVKAGIAAVVQLTDQYANLQNQIALTTSSQAETNQTISDLKEIANETGTSLDATAQLYVRTKNAITGLGYGAATAKKFTEELGKVIAVSGVDSQTAAAGMLQLSQGLSEGKLQGQDLKLVLADVPQIGQAIADHLGVSIDKLRTLGAEGKISAADVVNSFTGGTKAGEKFSNRIVTVSQVMQALHNDVEVFVGEVVGSLGPSLEAVVADFEDTLNSIKPAAQAIAQFVVKAGSREIKELAHFISSSAEAFGHQVDAIKGALGPLGEFLDKIDALGGGFENFAKLEDMTINATHSLADAIQSVLDKRAEMDAQLKFEADLAAKNQKVDEDRKHSNEEEAADFKVNVVKKVKSQAVLQQLLEAGLITAKEYEAQLSKISSQREAAANKAKAAAARHNAELERTLELADPIAKAMETRNKIADALIELTVRGDITFDQARETLERWTAANKAALDPLGALHEKMQEQIDDLALTDRQLALSQKQREIENDLLAHGVMLTDESRAAIAQEVAELDEAQRAHDRRAKAIEVANERHQEFLQGLADLPIHANEAKASLDELAQAFRDAAAERDPAAGAKAGLEDLKNEILDVGKLTRAAIGNTFHTLEDQLVAFVQKGTFDFHAFTEQVLGDLTRIFIRLALIKTIGTFAPGGAFGAAASKIPLFFASGGEFTVGGNGGRDRNFVPLMLSRGEHVTVQTASEYRAGAGGAGGGGPVVVAPTFQTVIDPHSFLDMMSSPAGNRAFVELVRLNRNVLRSVLS